MNSEMPRHLVQMRQIRKSFAGHAVLHGVDLQLQAGQIHALVGHNGAGKSTLMKVLAGLFTDYEGDIEVAGQPVRLSSPEDSLTAGIAVIHQEFALVPAFSVAQNILLGQEPRRTGHLMDHSAARARAKALLSSLGFDLPLDVPVGRLSVAHQQLTEIAKALSRNARVLVMDEPTARLAPAERQKLFETVRQLCARGVAVVYISHYLDEVLDIAHEITVLRDGQRVHHGPAAALNLPQLSELIVGTAPAPVEAAADASSAPQLRSMVRRPPVLDLQDFGAVGRLGSALTLHAGEIVGIAGLVGSGRSTLVEAICGALPSRGYLSVQGVPVRLTSPSMAADRGVVLVPEDRKRRGLVMASSAGSNMVLSALGRGLSRWGWIRRSQRRQRIAQAVQRFGIRGNRVAEQAARNLSGGNQQKVLLARAEATGPTLMVLDQPTAGVDIGAKQEIYAHIQAMARSGVACLFVSDELDELLHLSQRIAIVRQGAIAAELSPLGLTPHALLAHMSHSGSPA